MSALAEASRAGTVRVSVSADREDALEQWAAAYLEERGFYVEKLLLREARRETPMHAATRLGVHVKQVCGRLKELDCPPHEARRGEKTKRLVWFVSTARLDAYLQAKRVSGKPAAVEVVGKI